MQWYYAKDGRQVGPVSEEVLDNLIRLQEIPSQTLVWREGMSNWQPYAACRQAGTPPVIAAGSQSVCSLCGKPYARENLLQFETSLVCAQCKPRLVQNLKEGGQLPGEIWRENKQLVLRHGATLPDRCVKCNAPANGYQLRRKLSWHPPAYFLFLLCNILIYALVAIAVRKRAEVTIGLCEKHRARRKTIMWSAATAFVVGGFLIFLGVRLDNGACGGLGGLLALASLITATQATVISARKIDKEFVWISGSGQEFRESFPEWR